jgi:tetratricopeptide (TPR) repeat protein
VSREAPTDPRPDRLLGLIAKDSEQFADAIGYYNESLRRDSQQPDRESILFELAESQIKQTKFQDALVTLQECTRSAAALTWQAECLSNLGQIPEAQQRLREALEIDHRYVPAMLGQGTLFLDIGSAKEAVQSLAEAAQIEPQNSRVRFQLSQALRQLGKTEQADTELDRMREIQALEREFADLHEVASDKPSDADVRARIGELALQLGKTRLAQVWFRAALSINPNHERARTGLAQVRGSD